MAGPDFFLLNLATVAGGDKSAAYKDSGNIKHQQVLAEYQIPGNDPVVVGPATPLPVETYGVFTASPATLSDGSLSPLQMDSLGNIRVNLASGGLVGIADNGALFTIGTTPAMPGAMIVGNAASAPTIGNLAIPCMTTGRQQRVVMDLDTVGGLDVFHYINEATTICHLVKAGPGQVAWMDLANEGAIPLHLKWYDAASTGAVTLGTTAAKFESEIPCNANGAGRCPAAIPSGLKFTNGIVIAISSVFGVLDHTGGMTANVATATIGFK